MAMEPTMTTKNSTERVQTYDVAYISYQTQTASPPDFQRSYQLYNLQSTITKDDFCPGWRLKIARGENATTNLTGTRRKLEVKPGLFGYVFDNHGFTPSPSFFWTVKGGHIVDPFVVNEGSADTTKATNQAKMRFVNAALGQLGSFEGQVFLGELAETLHAIKRPLESLRRSFDHYHHVLRRRRKGSKNHKRKALAGTWLEFQFGWRPLVADAEDAIMALHNISKHRNRFAMVSGKGEDVIQLQNESVGASLGSLSWTRSTIGRSTVNVRYSGVVDLTMSNYEVVQSQLGFRLDRFVPTLWEVFPYSFVVDYFSNVGDMLSAWSLGNTRLKWVARSERIEYLYEIFSTSPYIANPSSSGVQTPLRLSMTPETTVATRSGDSVDLLLTAWPWVLAVSHSHFCPINFRWLSSGQPWL
jgi:hypothetical protein